MIEWKKYDPENPPKLDTEHLIFAKSYVGDRLCVAELTRWKDGKLYWEENMDKLSIDGVTHYAEINLPKGE